ncbi:MAG: hypothetical protein ABIJ14_03480 [Nanoarchaeota archaeon]
MAKKSRLVIPLILAGLLGVNYLSKTDVGQEALRYFQTRPAVVQVSSEKYIPSVGASVENDFQYNASDIWYNRMDSLENLAKTANTDSITSETISDLRTIARGDGDPRISDLASSMIESYGKNKDFSDTEPYHEMLAEKKRLTIKTSKDFGYNASDIWYKREGALRKLVIDDSNTPEDLLRDLETIADDDDWRIRDLASSMIKSYETGGDFRRVKID